MDCIDLFKRAAVALQTDSRYLVLDQTRKANDKDEELQNLIGEFNLARMDLNNEIGKSERNDARIHDRHRRDARRRENRRRLQGALCVSDKPDASYRHPRRGMVRRRLTEHGRHARGDLHDNRCLPERRSRVHPRAAE